MGYSIGKYQILFAVAGILCIIPLLFLRSLQDARGKDAFFILRSMLLVNPLKLALNLFSFHRSLARHYPEALQQIVGTCELIFERQVHRYNSAQEIGLRFLRELRDQNAALGNKVYWEECLVSIYELDLICAATTV